MKRAAKILHARLLARCCCFDPVASFAQPSGKQVEPSPDSPSAPRHRRRLNPCDYEIWVLSWPLLFQVFRNEEPEVSRRICRLPPDQIIETRGTYRGQ